MELDFDKEMDALLRNAAAGSSRGDAAGEHLDADALAAFAAGALPETTRTAYTRHMADCDRCRKFLAVSISFGQEPEPDRALSPVKATSATIAWHKRFFGLPVLVYTMGALVLLLSGFLGYSVLQRSNESANPDVSQVYEPEPSGGPSYDQNAAPSTQPMSNASSSNTSVATANATSNSSRTVFSDSSSAVSNSSGTTSNTSVTTGTTGVGAAKTESPATANEPAAPLPRIVSDAPVSGKNTKELDSMAKSQPKADEEKGRELEKQQRAASMPADDLKKMKDKAPTAALSAPAKIAGPRRDQNAQAQSMDSVAGAVETNSRTIGGKRFERRNGVWYDSSYHGQGTKNVRRASDAYKKLDAGLRSIAGSLDGVAVIVWEGKAYRIQ
jgi:hypothetical protein